MRSKTINIGLNGSMLDDKPTGVGVYSINVINHLAALYKKDKSRQITVFTPTSRPLTGDMKMVRLPAIMKSSEYGRVAAFTRFVWNSFYYPLQAKNFDVLLSTTTHGSFLLNRQILTIHDLLSLRFKNISPHQRFYFRYLLPYIVKKAKLIIAVSETTKKDIIEYLHCDENKIRVIHNGYDRKTYNNSRLHEKAIWKKYGLRNYFLAIGPTYPHKNFVLLLRTYKSLDKAVRTKFPLVIAGGKADYLAVLKKEVEYLALADEVRFLGYVPELLMASLYKEAYLLVFPSLFEGFGFPLLEAMACGCPVIASNCSSMPEVCGGAAEYFDPADGEALKTSIEKLVSDSDYYDTLVQKGLIQVKQFSWEKTARQLKETLEETIYLKS